MARWSDVGGGEVGFYGAGFIEVRPAVCRLTGCLSDSSRDDGLCDAHGRAQDALRVSATSMRAPGRGRYETAEVRRRRAAAMRCHGAPVSAIASALDVDQRSVWRYLGATEMTTPQNRYEALLVQAANVTLKWHAENCSTDMCDCEDEARELVRLAHILDCADTPLMRDVMAERDFLSEWLDNLTRTDRKYVLDHEPERP